MPFISQMMGRSVVDCDGNSVGSLKDLVASRRRDISHPSIVALIVRSGKDNLVVPASVVTAIFAPVIPLNVKVGNIEQVETNESDLFLVRDVLDKQIIDIDGMRVIRVNDLELTRVNDEVFVANLDVSGAGLLRRLGMVKLANQVSQRKQPGAPSGCITWDMVELLPGAESVRLKVSRDKISDLHPADLAEIVSDLSRDDGSALLEALDDQTLADTLEEVEPDFQASLVEGLSDERVADVLEVMAPDEAADLLAELPEDRSKELLKLMEEDEAKDVRRLLTYDEDTAGGIMNTEFVSVPPNFTAKQTVERLRKIGDEAETVYYIYVVDEDNKLVGVFSLRSLVLAQSNTPVSDFMETRVLTVDLNDTQVHIAQVVAKYNLIALPVVDGENHLQGIVTADDALDKILPTAWKKRLPRFYR